jgi:3-methylcrotonyl-CoA carboxylase beta subunit
VSVIKSKLNTRSEEYKANAAAMSALVADLREKTIAVSGGGSPETAAKHKARGKLLPRERINALIDPGAPFLEFSALAAYGMYSGKNPTVVARPAWSPASAGCRASNA